MEIGGNEILKMLRPFTYTVDLGYTESKGPGLKLN